jgi:hypothetical protein
VWPHTGNLLSSRRRRLSGAARPSGKAYSVHGRLLAHRAEPTKYRALPAETAVWEKNALSLYEKAGLGGQLRIIESNSCIPSVGTDFTNAGCFGAVWGYAAAADGAGVVNWDVSYYTGSLQEAPAGAYWDAAAGGAGNVARASTGQAAHALYGRQRGVFGPYLVVNKDEYTMEFWGYSGAGATAQAWALLYTTVKVPELQLLGSHEYYYWPGRDMLLTRHADGASFRFWRFASDFATSAAANDAVAGERKIT